MTTKCDAERAEAERLLDEGEHVVSIGWANSDDDNNKTVEHGADLKPPDKD